MVNFIYEVEIEGKGLSFSFASYRQLSSSKCKEACSVADDPGIAISNNRER
jgi:hypothetical protein